MALIGMRDVTWGLGGQPLLENISFQIQKGQRICLLGRNGVGKTSLLNILAGNLVPDQGEVWCRQGMKMATLGQEVPRNTPASVFEVIAQGLAPETKTRFGDSTDDTVQRIETVLSQTGLDGELDFAEISAGMKRRVMFARAWVQNPDLLILDEPTNHLDMDTIRWMETFILRHVSTLLFVTHDRTFLRNIATRILELDQGRLLSFDCDYRTYLQRRADLQVVEERQAAQFEKRLAQEETWIRQGIKARRTRNEGRVRALKRMREAYRARRTEIGSVSLQVQAASRSGNLVIEAQGIGQTYQERPVIENLSTVIMRGDKVGIIGPNGAGKTTLLKILLDQQAPEQGNVRHGTHLEVAYFDQLRMQLDEQKTVQENVGQGNDFIVVDQQKRHVISYLKDFLFAPERCRTPVHVLSGGEKNRLMLAKLLARPANVLVLDEPTNDLDIETLEMLEALLVNYTGTLLLVSHDRTFLNNVITRSLVFEGQGRVVEYAGGYDDWLVQRPAPDPSADQRSKPSAARPKKVAKPSRPRKLGYMEQRELEGLPARIEALESEQAQMFETMSSATFYQQAKAEITKVKSRYDGLTKEIESAYQRWDTLEQITAKS